MKTKKSVECRVPSAESKAKAASRAPCPRLSSLVFRQAFTLIELLVVISIIAVVAALLFPVVGMLKRQAFIRSARAQMAQLETAIGSYKSAYGFYPPDSHNTAASPTNLLMSQLFYELTGTILTNINGNLYYMTLDHSTQITPADVSSAFGVGGFMNCTKPGADESTPAARDFLPDLKPGEIGAVEISPGLAISNIVTTAGGPDPTYLPLGVRGVNPWGYNSSNPANNPGSYDLWIQLMIAGKTYLVCNWTKQVQINSTNWP